MLSNLDENTKPNLKAKSKGLSVLKLKPETKAKSQTII